MKKLNFQNFWKGKTVSRIVKPPGTMDRKTFENLMKMTYNTYFPHFCHILKNCPKIEFTIKGWFYFLHYEGFEIKLKILLAKNIQNSILLEIYERIHDYFLVQQLQCPYRTRPRELNVVNRVQTGRTHSNNWPLREKK